MTLLMRKLLKLLPPTIWILGGISFLNDAASELIYPLMPLYLTTVLAAGPRALGLIEGVADSTSSLFKLFSGYFSDYTRSRKGWVVWGYVIAALTRPLIALARTWPIVLALRFADRLGKGLRSAPRDALMAASVPASQRGLAFGLHRAMDNSGAVVGPLVAAWLLHRGMPIRDIILWTALPGALCVLLSLYIREPAREIAMARPPRLSLAELPPVFRRYLVVLGFFYLSNTSTMFLLLRARALGVSDFQIPLLWALTSLIPSLLGTHLSSLSDRIGRTRLIVVGWGGYVVSYLILAWGGPVWSAWLAFTIYGFFLAATEGAERALVADLAPTHILGTAYGWFNLVMGVMLLPASVVFGWVWYTWGAPVAFGISAVMAIVAVLGLWTWVEPDVKR